MDTIIKERVQEWLTEDYDARTRKEIQSLIDENNEKELINRFYQDLDFGTGGLRGIIGAGTNRMNPYVVAKVTQGLAAYILKQGDKASKKGVVIAYDSRHKSPEFALETALVFAGNGIKAYLFESLRPTPLLSFAVRHLGAIAGINITASHNPKEYNGYKVYWEDGAQVVPPHDKNIINEVRQVKSIKQIKKINKEDAIAKGLLEIIGEKVDEAYLDKSVTLSINPHVIKKTSGDLRIVYTPIHGSGITLVPELLNKLGYKNVRIVEAQREPDPDFPTVVSPNPEEGPALKLALDEARQIEADIVMATDPDADRIGIAVKDNSGDYILLSGNQTGALLVYYVLSQLKSQGKLPQNGVIIKTIVTTELQRVIAENFGVESIDVLTGFKYIAEKIREFETQASSENPLKRFLVGGEESYGYLIGTFARDKDAVITAAILAELTAYAKSENKSVYGILQEIYEKYGYYNESLASLSYMGKEGMDTISNIMSSLRNCPPKQFSNIKVNYISDYQLSVNIEPEKGQVLGTIELPQSNVLAFNLADGSKITIRPSGTEPKIKIYFATSENCDGKSLDNAKNEVKLKLDNFKACFLDEIRRITG